MRHVPPRGARTAAGPQSPQQTGSQAPGVGGDASPAGADAERGCRAVPGLQLLPRIKRIKRVCWAQPRPFPVRPAGSRRPRVVCINSLSWRVCARVLPARPSGDRHALSARSPHAGHVIETCSTRGLCASATCFLSDFRDFRRRRRRRCRGRRTPSVSTADSGSPRAAAAVTVQSKFLRKRRCSRPGRCSAASATVALHSTFQEQGRSPPPLPPPESTVPAADGVRPLNGWRRERCAPQSEFAQTRRCPASGRGSCGGHCLRAGSEPMRPVLERATAPPAGPLR